MSTESNSQENVMMASDRLTSIRAGWRKWCNLRPLSRCTDDDQRAGWNLAAEANDRGGTRPTWAEANELDAADLPALLWSELGGVVKCTRHLGHYARFELDQAPTASVLSTPITVWSVIKTRKAWMRCETCMCNAEFAARANA